MKIILYKMLLLLAVFFASCGDAETERKAKELEFKERELKQKEESLQQWTRENSTALSVNQNADAPVKPITKPEKKLEKRTEAADISVPKDRTDQNSHLSSNFKTPDLSDLVRDNRAPAAQVREEKEAYYPGNWSQLLNESIRNDIALRNGAPVGIYNVIVQFVINQDGAVTDIRPLTYFGYGMEDEVIRAIRKSGRWVPAVQNGKAVKTYRKQPIIFQVTN